MRITKKSIENKTKTIISKQFPAKCTYSTIISNMMFKKSYEGAVSVAIQKEGGPVKLSLSSVFTKEQYINKIYLFINL